MKKISIVVTAIIMLITFSACQIWPIDPSDNIHPTVNHEDNSEGEKTMELTQRQREILEKEGLPINYGQLDDGQKKAIMAIEEMFSYLDEKYDVSFEYVGYRAPGPLDKEALIVCPEGGTSAENFSVIREDGKCSDDYANVYYRDAYEKMIKDYVETNESRVEVFSDIEEVVDVQDEADLRPNVSATTGIYFAADAAGNVNLAEKARELGQWYAAGANGMSCSFSLYIVQEASFWSLTRFNRAEFDDDVIEKVNVTIKADGSVIVR